jgi:hypothetical protein
MSTDQIADEVRGLREALGAQNAGLVRILGVLASQTTMLERILTAVTAEPEGPSPLAESLAAIVQLLEQQSTNLDRIGRGIDQVGLHLGVKAG